MAIETIPRPRTPGEKGAQREEQFWLANRVGLSIAEAARAVGVSERRMREVLPEIPHTHLGRRVVIPRVSLEAWRNERSEASPSSTHVTRSPP